MMRTNLILQTSKPVLQLRNRKRADQIVISLNFLTILVGQTPVLTSSIGLENRTILLKSKLVRVGMTAMFSYQNPSLKKLKEGEGFQFLLLNL